MTYLEDGVAKGMDVDLGKALAAQMKREIRIDLMDWNLAQEKVLNGEADGLIGMSISDERRKLFDFASPMFNREFGLLVRSGEMTIRSAGDLKGKSVGVTPGGFPRRFLETQPGVNLILINNYQEGFDRLTAGTIDAIAADLWVAAYLMEKGHVSGVTVTGKPFATAEAAIAVKKGNSALLGEINRAINTLKADGTVSEIRETWRPKEMLFVSREKIRFVVTRALAVVLVVLFGTMGMWIITLKKQIGIRRKAELALKESEQHFRNLTQAAFEGIAISENGRILAVNDQCLKMFGYERDEMIGREIIEMVAPEFRAIVTEAIRTNRESIYGHRLLRKDGSSFYGEAQAKINRIGNRIVRMTALRDITERKQTEEALRTSEESLRATIENTPYVAVQWYDRQGRVVFWNHASELLYGWTFTEAAGRTLDQLIFGPAQAEKFQQALLEIEQTGKAVGPVEFPVRRKDGSSGIILSTLFRIQLPSGEPRFVCMDVDLTERKAAEASLRQAQERELRVHEEFAQHLLTAQEKERQRLASELHDSLGQNLSIIKNRAHLAQQLSGIPKDGVAHLEAIERVVAEAITETRNLAHNLRPQHIEQIGLTDSLRELIREVSQSSNIHFERRVENVDDVLKGEAATNVYRIVQEALNNLVKHSQATEASVTLERDVRSVRLRVADDGVGFVVQRGVSRGGLGLTSIGERARMLGGTLKIESAPGKGTRLTIELPIADGENQS